MNDYRNRPPVDSLKPLTVSAVLRSVPVTHALAVVVGWAGIAAIGYAVAIVAGVAG